MMNLGQYIAQYCAENHMSIRQFAEKSGITRSYIFVLKNRTRNPGIEVIRKAAKAMGMSYDDLLNQIDVGLPKGLKNPDVAHEIPVYKCAPLIDDNIIDTVAVTKDFQGAYFAYRISSADMAPLVNRNATVIVKLTDKVENDSIVVASVNGETFCRKYTKTSDGILLTPMNPQASTISLNRNDAKTALILYGKVVEVRFNI